MSALLAVLAGQGGPRVRITAQTIADIQNAPSNASATYNLLTNGVVRAQTVSSGNVDLENWIVPTSLAGGNYECRATLNSGALTSGTTGTWLALSSSRSWNVTGNQSANLTIEIRATGASSPQTSATIALSATTI